jgi:hypothetical protein
VNLSSNNRFDAWRPRDKTRFVTSCTPRAGQKEGREAARYLETRLALLTMVRGGTYVCIFHAHVGCAIIKVSWNLRSRSHKEVLDTTFRSKFPETPSCVRNVSASHGSRSRNYDDV